QILTRKLLNFEQGSERFPRLDDQVASQPGDCVLGCPQFLGEIVQELNQLCRGGLRWKLGLPDGSPRQSAVKYPCPHWTGYRAADRCRPAICARCCPMRQSTRFPVRWWCSQP